MAERDELVRALRDGGHTQAEIAEQMGVSRQRIHQLVGSYTVQVSSLDPIRVMRALRDPQTTCAVHVREAAGISLPQFATFLAETGLRPAVLRLFRWRKMGRLRQRFATKALALAAQLGRTPTVKEVIAHCGGVGQYEFGSLRAMWLYVGLTPNPKGGSGHVHRTSERYLKNRTPDTPPQRNRQRPYRLIQAVAPPGAGSGDA